MIEATLTTERDGDRFAGRVFVDVARSELAKLFTVRATYLNLAAAVVVIVGTAIGLCEAYVRHVVQLSLTQLEFNPTSFSLSGVLVAQLIIGVLGILVITSEHATGLIRSTFAAVPQRGTVLAAKATVFGLVTLVASEAATFIAFGIGQAILASNHTGTTLSAPGVLRAVAGPGSTSPCSGLSRSLSASWSATAQEPSPCSSRFDSYCSRVPRSKGPTGVIVISSAPSSAGRSNCSNSEVIMCSKPL